MNLKRYSRGLRAAALSALFVAGTSVAAFALPIVSFTTTGTFGSSGTNVATFTGGGTATLTYNGTSNSIDVHGISNANFGDFLLTTSGNFSGAASTPFTLNIFQTAPTGGSASLLASLTGSFVSEPSPSVSGTDFTLSFNTTTAMIDGVTYTLQPIYFIAPPTSGAGGTAQAGTTTIQGRITAASPVPEPASMLLLGTGLVAAFRARRKFGVQ